MRQEVQVYVTIKLKGLDQRFEQSDLLSFSSVVDIPLPARASLYIFLSLSFSLSLSLSVSCVSPEFERRLCFLFFPPLYKYGTNLFLFFTSLYFTTTSSTVDYSIIIRVLFRYSTNQYQNRL